jgi:N-dimethylarginine dimethylaminohydrolase
MNPKINKTVLMSGADYFTDDFAINALMDDSIPVDVEAAKKEHSLIRQSLENAGIKVVQIPAPEGCQDGVYTANWALIRGGKAIMARLPNKRQDEEPYAREALKQQGIEFQILPDNVERFSGQGDALPCGDVVFTQSPYRTTTDAHPYLKEWLGFSEVIALETKPDRGWHGLGPARINKITGWPDSPTYDIDLAIAILKFPEDGQKGLIAWCPEVFKPSSRKILKNYDKVDKIEVSRTEALKAFALNLVSTGETVILNAGAPKFQADLEAHGLKTVTLDLPELRKGGGSIRCSTLTLDN